MNQEAAQVWAGLEFRRPAVLSLIEELTQEQVLWRPAAGRNCVAWQLWHIAEVEDNWVRDLLLAQPKHYPFGVSVRNATPEEYPSKAELTDYFQTVRRLSRSRLEEHETADFGRQVDDASFGRLTVAQVWAGVVTSFAWHGGQIALTVRLMNPNSA